jgi:translation initiation factor 2B subunit (eIF-2B alpha/beta/delta family)
MKEYTLIDYLPLILNDNKSGSNKILDRITNDIIEYLTHTKAHRQNAEAEISAFINKILNKFPNFVVIWHFAKELKKSALALKDDVTFKNDLKKSLGEYKAKWEKNFIAIAERAAKLINFANSTVLLHSNSKSVTDVLVYLTQKGNNFRVIQTVSGPVNEGIFQAKNLADNDIKVKLISDFSLMRYIPEIDYAILGADAVLEDGIINKAGSFIISDIMKENDKPVYVFADSRKFARNCDIPSEIDLNFEEKKCACELLEEQYPNIYPENYYFEKVPFGLITEIISESDLKKQ